MASLRIDVDRFLALTAALAATSCGPRAGQHPEPALIAQPGNDLDTAQPTPTVTIVEPPPSAPEPATSAEVPLGAAPGCDNDAGEVSCAFADPRRFTGPMCEGVEGTCDLLANGYGYRKRAAAAIARCWEQRGANICDIQVRKACIRTALQEACPDPSFEPFCKDAFQACRQRGIRPRYTVEECVKTLSSLVGGNLDWAKSSMGSPSQESCQLMFPVW